MLSARVMMREPLLGQRLEVGEGVQEVRGVGGLPLLRCCAWDGRSRCSWVSPVGCAVAQTCSSRCSRSHGEMTFMNSAYSISLTSV